MTIRSILVIGLLALVGLAGCVDDNPDKTGTDSVGLATENALWMDPQNTPHPAYGWATVSSPGAEATGWHAPIAGTPLPETLTGMEHIAGTAGEYSDGGGIALYGSLAVVPGFGTSVSAVYDISDPTMPVQLSTFEPQLNGSHRGATIIAYPNGDIVTVISMGAGLDVWDITDPAKPVPLPPIFPGQGSHKVGVVPGTPIIYNAASNGGSANGLAGSGHLPGGGVGITEIFDLSNKMNATHVMDWQNGYSCHHLYFFNFEDKQRGVCAGIEMTQIWDMADPLNPTVIVDVPVHHGVAETPSASVPIVAFSHFAGMNNDGTVLLVGDEMGGGGLPPGCVGEARTPLASGSTPVGALWFYDITDETNPIFQGYYSPLNDPTVKATDVSCTAHHGRLVPMPDQDVIAMSFYGAGVILVDFTLPTAPRVIDQFVDGSDTWETWYYDGYLFTGDLARGMDVLKLV